MLQKPRKPASQTTLDSVEALLANDFREAMEISLSEHALADAGEPVRVRPLSEILLELAKRPIRPVN